MSRDQAAKIEAQLADDVAYCYADALRFVLLAFPWDTDASLQVVDWYDEETFVDPKTGIIYSAKPNSVTTVTFKEWMSKYRQKYPGVRYGPDRWACEWLDEVSREVAKRKFNGTKAVAPIRMCTASGHGIGKSTLTAWVILWIMSTRLNARGTVTANTADQLRTKTWAELGKWYKRCITSHWFNYNAGRGNMTLRHVDSGEEWQCSAQTCREENSESFAGQHAANSTSFYIFDEASAVPDKIYVVREGGTVTGHPMVFDFGNPTRNSGWFFEKCEGRLRRRHIVRKIDSRTVYITNKERIAEWIEDFGIDSDFVRVRVLGEFPSAGSLQFMPTAWVQRAMMRELPPRDRYAVVKIGVDVARFGDDNSVIYPVVGNDARSWAPTPNDGIYNGLDNIQLANKVIEKDEFFRRMGMEVAPPFIDAGAGSGVIDYMRSVGYDCMEIGFGTTPAHEPKVYRYRGDEMWGRTRTAIKERLVLPALPELAEATEDHMGVVDSSTATKLLAELTQREFGYTLQGDKIHLETKKDMKSRGVSSPDLADGLVLAVSQDVAPSKAAYGENQGPTMTNHQFNPADTVSVA